VTHTATHVKAHEHELIALRRHLHTQPEPSGEEFLTTELIRDRLLVEGLAPVVLRSGTGVVCDIPMGLEGGPIVALRADIDGLAMDDLTDTPYRSQRPGFAHACGHDVHITSVLGAALALLDARENQPRAGTVRLIFEPAEEVVPGGAVDIIDEGWLDAVWSIYGVHCDPKIDVGRLGLRTGPLTSAADQFEIRLEGPGGHTARPQVTVDLVRWTARVAARLWDVMAEQAGQPVTVVFGSVHAGAAANVIPSSARLTGSFRTPDPATWEHGEKLMRAALDEIMAAPGIGDAPAWTLGYRRGLPPVVNDAATTDLVRSAAEHLWGAEAAISTPQSMGGDSFAWYTERIPGTYVRLGTHDPDSSEARQDLHSATFNVDERAIAIGAALLAESALRALDHHS
jgi:amidohydrolase